MMNVITPINNVMYECYNPRMGSAKVYRLESDEQEPDALADNLRH